MNLDFWSFVDRNLNKGLKVGLLIVVESTPGSPGRTGFKMALSGSGEQSGTIGGGIMELQLVRTMTSMLSEDDSDTFCKPVLSPQVHRKQSAQTSGLICSGAQTVALMVLTQRHRKFTKTLTEWTPDHADIQIRLSESGFETVCDKPCPDQFSFDYEHPACWTWIERHGPESRCYIVGGGHVGLSLSRVLALLDTHITVFDHRSDLEQIKNNTFADKFILGSYKDVYRSVHEGDNSYVFVVSTSFKTDEEALTGLLTLRVGYLGLMASQTKKEKIFLNLLEKGVASDTLDRIHCPIGLPIASRTTDEIAVSIAAQMIQVKNSRCEDRKTLSVLAQTN